MFQSTRPRRARHLASPTYSPASSVSIHAPTQGATRNHLQSGLMRLFQSTRPRRARRFQGYAHRYLLSFNPRAHAGRDSIRQHTIFTGRCFNPRAHAGRDVA